MDYRDHRHSFTERVIINFSPEQLKRLHRYLRGSGENCSGFIRRVTLEKLAQLGFGPDQERGLGDLIQETRRDIKIGSR